MSSFLPNYNAFFAVSANFANSAALFKAISAKTFLSNTIPAFFNPFIKVEYVNPFNLAAVLILMIHRDLILLLVTFLSLVE